MEYELAAADVVVSICSERLLALILVEDGQRPNKVGQRATQPAKPSGRSILSPLIVSVEDPVASNRCRRVTLRCQILIIDRNSRIANKYILIISEVSVECNR